MVSLMHLIVCFYSSVAQNCGHVSFTELLYACMMPSVPRDGNIFIAFLIGRASRRICVEMIQYETLSSAVNRLR
jgi:hypothetical protein